MFFLVITRDYTTWLVELPRTARPPTLGALQLDHVRVNAVDKSSASRPKAMWGS